MGAGGGGGGWLFCRKVKIKRKMTGKRQKRKLHVLAIFSKHLTTINVAPVLYKFVALYLRTRRLDNRKSDNFTKMRIT